MSDSSSQFFLLKCAHCESHFKLPGNAAADVFVSCPACGGGLRPGVDHLVPNKVNLTRAAAEASLPATGARIPAILPRDAVPSASRGIQSPEFGGASFAAPPSARAEVPVSAPTPSDAPQTSLAKDTFIPERRGTQVVSTYRPASIEKPAEYVKPDGWEIEQTDEKPVSAPEAKTPRAVFFALTGLVLALCTWVTFKLIAGSEELAEQNAAENKARREAIEAQAPKDPEADARRARLLAGEVAYRFLHAQNPRALVEFVRDPEYVETVFERIYSEPDSFKPFEYDRTAPDEEIRISEDGKYFSVDVTQADGTIKPLTLERIKRRLMLADWNSYVGYSELEWADLLVERPSDPVFVRARVTPGDYFAGEFDNDKLFTCYTLTDDARQVTIYGYVPSRGTIATETLTFTEEEIANGTERLVMLSISYPEKTRKTNQVKIEEFIGDGWFRK